MLPASGDTVPPVYFFSKTGNTIAPVSAFPNNPRQAADTLFGNLPTSSTAPPPPTTFQDRLTARRGTIVDAVSGNLTALRNRVSSVDRARLDAHAEHLHALSRRFAMPAPVNTTTCTKPDLSTIPSINGVSSPAYGPNDNQTAPAQIDNLIRAFACDITRVAGFVFNVTQGPSFPWLYNGSLTAGWGGFSDWHVMVHDGQATATSSGVPFLTTGFKFYGEQFTRLVQGLAATPDIGGTSSLLDNTLVLWMSDFGNGGGHNVDDLPAILAGLTGKIQTGRHLDLAGTGYTTGDLFATVLRLLGAPDNVTFGLTGNMTTAYDRWCGNFPLPYPFHKGFIPV